MNLAHRTFVLDRTDHLYRLSQIRFSAMLSDPRAQPIPEFASQRIRAAGTTVELIQRQPSRVVRMVFFMLEFDEKGVLKVNSLMQHSAAAMETLFAAHDRTEGNVLDAQSRFVASGGRWKSTAALHRLLSEAALGKIQCSFIPKARRL